MTGGTEGSLSLPPTVVDELFGPRRALVERYAELLATVAVERGLLGPREVARLWERHLLNCVVVADIVPERATVVDIGSGAGLPGIVLAIARPDLHITLLDPLLRRVTFLDECIAELSLDNVSVRRGRAEEVAGEFAADVATARAVAPLERLIRWGLPLVKSGGVLLALKGERAYEELERVRPGLQRAGVAGAEVFQVGHGKVDPPTTVVRVVAGNRKRGRRVRKR